MKYEQVDKDVAILKMLVERSEHTYLCNRGPRPSGAVLKLNDESAPLVLGSVQPPARSPSCKDDGCMMVDGHCVRNLHAEVDALLTAANLGLSTYKSEMYSINKPCYNCTLAIIKAGVHRIYYAYAVYDEDRTRDALLEAGVECNHVPIE